MEGIMDDECNVHLIFDPAWTEIDEFETPMKGYRNCIVELPDKRRFSVCFYDSVRLQQDLEDEKIIAEIGLIVLEKVTKEKMEEAIYKLWKTHYFEQFIPL